jgi:C1A family cysteine protease
MKRTYGWLRQPHDDRDLRYVVPTRLTAVLPTSIDLAPHMGPQLDQQDLGACGPNTADECIEFDQAAEGEPIVSASRLFIYYATRMLMGTVGEDSGVDNRTLLKALNKYGFCAESLWPYVTSKFTVKPPKACFTAALKNCIRNYAAVAQTHSQMCGTLTTGRPFVFGFDCFAALESDSVAATGILPTPRAGQTPIGGHDVTICGFTTIDRPGIKKGNKWPKNTYRARNHWVLDDGTPHGDGGYLYVPFAYAENAKYASDFWVVNAIP